MPRPPNFNVERIRKAAAGQAIVGASFLKDTAAFVLGEQSVLLIPPDADERQVSVHGGVTLSSAGGGERLMTGGDDGRVVAVGPDGSIETVFVDAKRRWIDCVAAGPRELTAWSAGKQAFVRAHANDIQSLDLPSTVGGLSFSPDGELLAVAHYNGVTLWRPGSSGTAEVLEWKGSHLSATTSPNGEFIVTTMLEPALHGWRLSDRTDIPMQGYLDPVRSVDWTPGGKWLATSGSQYLVLWPFQQFDHPAGAVPLLLCGYRSRSTVVACHPLFEIVAVGYEDGIVLLISIGDETEILVKNPGGSPVSALAWNAPGTRLALGCEDGAARVIDFSFAE